jgi:hypothetical protein
MERINWSKRLKAFQVLKCKEVVGETWRFCDSYSRLDAILKLYLALPDRASHPVERKDQEEIFYACLGFEWSGFDNIASYKRPMNTILGTATRRLLNLMMTDEELAAWKKLPDPITAYRFGYHNNLNGFSFSLKREVAESFSTYHRYTQSGNNEKFLITVTIPKKFSVLKLDREEHEIIATRWDKVVRIGKDRVYTSPCPSSY